MKIAPALLTDPVRRIVAERIEALDLDLSAVSKELGANHAYMQQYFNRGVPQDIPEKHRARLAALLGLAEDDLRREVNDVSATDPSTLSTTHDGKDSAGLNVSLISGPDSATGNSVVRGPFMNSSTAQMAIDCLHELGPETARRVMREYLRQVDAQRKGASPHPQEGA